MRNGGQIRADAGVMENAAAGLLRKMLGRLQNTEALPGAGLAQCRAIYVLDSSIVTLPKALQAAFPGFASAGSEAAMKGQLSDDYRRGNFGALELEAVRTHDQSCTLAVRLAQMGSLHSQDLGYFDQDNLAAIDRVGGDFVSRLKYGTALYVQPGDKEAFDLLSGFDTVQNDGSSSTSVQKKRG